LGFLWDSDEKLFLDTLNVSRLLRSAPNSMYIYMCLFLVLFYAVAFRIYDMDNDGFISNGELFQVLKMMVGNNLKETQLQQIVDKTVINADKDGDGKISFSEFCAVSIVNCLNCCLNST